MHQKVVPFLSFLFLLLFVFAQDFFGQEPRGTIDSIEAELPHLGPSQRLDALSAICNEATTLNDASYEQACLRRLFEEADAQGATNIAGYAYANLICSFYNYNMFDELLAEFPKTLAYQERVGNYIYYYEEWQLLIDMYLHLEKNYEALSELQRMHDDAKRRNNALGQATALAKMGEAFGMIYRDFDAAAENYTRAIELFSQMEYVSGQELNSYFEYTYLLYQMRQWDELRKTARLWKKRLDKIHKEQDKDLTSITMREFYYYSMALIVESEQKNFKEAEKYIELLRQTIKACPEHTLPMLYEAFECYFSAVGQLDSALYYNLKNIEYSLTTGSSVNSTDAIYSRAELFMQLKQYDSAARLYDLYVAQCDSVDDGNNREELNEFRTLSEVEALKSSQRIFRTRLLFILGIIILVGGFLVLLIVYSRQLHKKNKILFALLGSHLDAAKAVIATTGEGALCANDETREKLYQQLCSYMQEFRPYCDPKFDRDTLTKQLQTTRTELTEVLRFYEKGASISEYIDHCRAKHAADLLTLYSQTTISDIGIVSGFDSLSSFNRLFRQFFGMSPAEYRSIAIEYKRRLLPTTSIYKTVSAPHRE